MLLPLVFLATLACGEKFDDTGSSADGGGTDGGGTDGGGTDGGGTDGGGDTGPACGSTQGFVHGTVSGPYSPDPNPYAQVQAVSSDGTIVPAELGGDGSYELNLEGGSWTLRAMAEGCPADDLPQVVEACQDDLVDIHVPPCDVADKPNLYLYPARPTPTRVRLLSTDRQRVVASAPAYPQDGWQGLALPDGSFQTGGQRAPYLFYELSLAPWQSRRMQTDQGWCLPQEGAVQAMAELLGAYGFSAPEREDFVDAWTLDLPPSPDGYAVYPQTEVSFAGQVEIQPRLPLQRLWLRVEDGAGCVEGREPVVVPFDRSGPHAVEWGVILHDLAR